MRKSHLKDKYLKPKKIKANTKKPAEKSETKKDATVSIAETMSDDDCAWATEELFIESGSDWFDEKVEAEVECISAVCVEDDSVGVVVDEFEEDLSVMVDVEELGDTSEEAFVVAKSVQTSAKAKLYNSSCTNHIFPYKASFENFKSW